MAALNPTVGSSPAASMLRGTYNQTYVIFKRETTAESKEDSEDSDEGDFQERSVLFRCGNWCYTGHITLDKSHISLGDAPKVIPTLQRQQNRLHYYCNAGSVPEKSPFRRPMDFINDATDFAAKELASDAVLNDIADQARTETWIDNAGTYFELLAFSESLEYMDNVALAASKTYGRGLIFMTIYFEASFYVMVLDGSGDQPLLDVKFPDLSQPGAGLCLKHYTDADDCIFSKLTLWHGLGGKQQAKHTNVIQQPKTTNLSSDAYVQMYIILRGHKEIQNGNYNVAATKLISQNQKKTNGISPHHDVLFRFGSWCYSGSVQLTPELELQDLPHIIPALRMQQSRLDFVCDVSKMPTTSPFTKPMAYLAGIAQHLEKELVASEAVLQKLVDQLAAFDVGSSVSRWLDGEGPQSFFEFQLADSKKMKKAFRGVELVATKTYSPTGVVLICVMFQGTIYVVLSENSSEAPLLDSRFPDVSSKGRGYLVGAYPDGLPGWRELRKVSIWQTRQALEADLGGGCCSQQKFENILDVNSATAAVKVEQNDDSDDKPVVSSPAKGDDDDDDDVKPDAAETPRKEETASVAEPKTDTNPLLMRSGSLGGSSSKVNAPHRIPAVASLSQSLAKVRADLGAQGTAAPWDEFGRPKSMSFRGK